MKRSHPAFHGFSVVLILVLQAAFIGGSTGLAAAKGEAFDMINEARTIARTGNYAEALDKLQAAVGLADQNEEKLALAIAYDNIGEIHRLQGNKIEALESYSQALQIYHEIGHRKGIASTGQKIDTILGRTAKTEATEPPPTIQEPVMVQEPQVTQVPVPEPSPEPSTENAPQAAATGAIPETVVTSLPPIPTTPQEVTPSPRREELIEEAIKRVRNRVRDRQAIQEASEPAPPEIPKTRTPSPQEPPQQSAMLDTPPITRPTDYSAYLEGVKKNIVQAWKYPEQASERGLEGKVDVEFTILKNGRLLDVRILESSGYSALDREAIRAVGAASPFTPIPKQIDLEQLSIRFTFNYTLEKRRGTR